MFTLAEGQKFERYRVIRLLGSGISGTTYEVEDIVLNRKVALKLIHPWSILPDSARRQFFRNMQSFSLLTHPYQAATLDYGEADGQLYTVSRFVTAGSLLNDEGRRWFSPPLPVKEAISYTYQLAQALYNVHRYGYVHGALTLSNILVLRSTNFDNDPDFAPFLLADVGMAQFVRRFGHPKISRFLITDAPEQARGRVTAASDQYALAVLLYLWLAGQPPFLGSPEEIEQAKRSSTIPRLATQNPHITFEQEGIIQRALSGYPDDRYPTILTFAEALQASLTRANQTSATSDSARSSYPIKTEPLNQFLPTATPEATLPIETIPTLTEDGTETSKGNRQESAERISATFVLDQQELARLTAIAKQEPLTLEPQAKLPEPSAKPLDMLHSVPLELPTSGDVENDSGISLSHRSVGEYGNEPASILPETEPAQAQTSENALPSIPDTSPSLPVPTSPPITPSLSVLIQETDEEGITPVKTEPLSTETDHTDPSSPIFIITSPYTENAREFTLHCQETTIGRAGSSDILLEQDALASRHHAVLKYEDQRYVIYDCRSSNGVTLNGQKLTPEVGYPLTNGDHIQIGEYHLTFRNMTSQKQSRASKEHAI
jgi:serine/threonine protein kinase